MAPRAGFIGLGNIGRPMAERLVKGGLPTVVYDLRPEASAGLTALGARAASSCAELAAAADVIGVCVRDDADVERVALGADGLIAHAAPGTVIALHSTILPSTVKTVGAAAEARGVAVVDAPITGAAGGAESGTLTYMVGGAAEALERCRPQFATSAAKIVHTGELGSGMVTKLCNNLIGYLHFLAAFEADLLATRAGLKHETLLEVTRSGDRMTETMATFLRYRRAIENEPADSPLQARARTFTDLAEKDLAVTVAYARELGITLPAAPSASS